MSNIKYLGFAKPSSSVPVMGQLEAFDSTEEELKAEAIKVLTRLKDFELRADQRQKMKSQLGCWHCKKDCKGVLYLALCSPNYPERHIYAAINQLRDHLGKLGDYQTEPDSTLKLHCKEFLSQLCRDFEELRGLDKASVVGGLDKVSVVGGLLGEVKDDMRRNTHQMISNMFNAEKLEERSERMKDKALEFQETAEDVGHKLGRRKCTIRVLLAISLLSLLLLLITPVATSTVT